MTTSAPGCSAFQARSCSASIESASEQPASRSGIRTVFSGERIEAVSAMKWTPQKAIASASVAAACAREAERVAEVVGDVLDLGQLVVVGEDHRVALGGERADLLAQGSDLLRRERPAQAWVGSSGAPAWSPSFPDVRWPGAFASNQSNERGRSLTLGCGPARGPRRRAPRRHAFIDARVARGRDHRPAAGRARCRGAAVESAAGAGDERDEDLRPAAGGAGGSAR